MNFLFYFSSSLLVLVLCASGATKVTFDDHVLPIFEQACLNCHNPDKTKGGLDLSSFGATLKGSSGGKIAEPGDSGSSLIGVVMHSSEPKMPPEGDKLSKAHIDTLKAWIAGGLLENKSSSARKPSKPKFDASLKANTTGKPDGPPPMPQHILLEPEIVTSRPAAIFSMATSPWAPLLAVTGQRQVLLFHTESLELVGILPFPEGDPVSLAFTPNSRYLIVGGGVPGKSGITITFDVTTGERVLTAAKEFDTVLASDLSPDLSTVASGSPSRLIKLWNTEDGSQLHSIKKHTDWVTSLDFSPDGILLATGDRNGGVWVWESSSGNEFHTLRAHQAGITSTRFRADSNVLATASEDGSLRFWEMNNGKEIKKIDAHPGGVLAFSWARDGSFATAGRDKKVKVWKPDFGQRHEIKGLPDIPTAIALDAEGKRVFIADFSGTIFVHETEKAARVGEFDTNPPSITTRTAALGKEIAEFPETLRNSVDQQRKATEKLAETKKRVSDAENRLRQAREQIKSSEQTLTQLKKQQGQTRNQQDQARSRLKQLQAQVAPLQDQINKSNAAQKTLTQSIASADREIKAANTQLQAVEKSSESEDKAEKIKAAQAHLEQFKKEHRTQLAQQKREQDALKPLVAKLAVIRRDLAEQEADRESLAQEAKTLPASIAKTNKLLAASKKRPSEIEKQIQALKKAVAPAENELKKADEALLTTKGQLESIVKQEAHWSAAGINAKAIKTAEAAAALEMENEVLADEFAALTRDFESTSAKLAEERNRQTRLSAELQQADNENRREELGHELAALEEQLRKQAAGLAGLEAEMLAARNRLDKSLPMAHRLRNEASELKALFLEAITKLTVHGN